MATAYRYSPLSPDTDDIRLLTLKPGREADDIAITLQHCSLVATTGQYEALSYVWGSTDDPTTVEVEDVLVYWKLSAARWQAWTLPLRGVLKCTSQLYVQASRPFVTVSGGQKGAIPFLPTTSNRAFVSTHEGYMGIAPASAREGDAVYAIPSCPCLIVLRPVQAFEDRFQVVGACFLYGLNNGEAALGVQPSHIRTELQFIPEARGWCHVYRNIDTGEVSYEDPRLLALGIHPRLGQSGVPMRVSAETLERAGVRIDRIDLV
ncbi:hypothetical protein VM1G_11678 [Cytospora mali]|uniref:Heterokaryon incompatibility domain-containing protein n=1 Tax=Cytospora mali TaxID=578113 RepID=A0A194W3B1_CYTMA|nr:hypothetical protein VM1G_11678 [Valsa mali]